MNRSVYALTWATENPIDYTARLRDGRVVEWRHGEQALDAFDGATPVAVVRQISEFPDEVPPNTAGLAPPYTERVALLLDDDREIELLPGLDGLCVVEHVGVDDLIEDEPTEPTTRERLAARLRALADRLDPSW